MATAIVSAAAGVIGVVLTATGLWRDLFDFKVSSAPETATSEAAPVPASEDPPLYSSGNTVAMGKNWAVKFDSPWTDVHINNGDITIDEVDVATQPNAAFARAGANPTYQSCRHATYDITSVPLEDLTSPTSMCVQRADGRIGVVDLRWVNGKKGDSLRVSVKGYIWDTPWGTPR